MRPTSQESVNESPPPLLELEMCAGAGTTTQAFHRFWLRAEGAFQEKTGELKFCRFNPAALLSPTLSWSFLQPPSPESSRSSCVVSMHFTGQLACFSLGAGWSRHTSSSLAMLELPEAARTKCSHGRVLRTRRRRGSVIHLPQCLTAIAIMIGSWISSDRYSWSCRSKSLEVPKFELSVKSALSSICASRNRHLARYEGHGDAFSLESLNGLFKRFKHLVYMLAFVQTLSENVRTAPHGR